MIDRLTGVVAAKSPEGIVVDVGGVGFLAEVSGFTMREVPAVGAPVTLYAHLHVREDALQLFGFANEEERELFRQLIGVSKIGPKLALAVLSSRRPRELKQALATGDVGTFAAVPGIGRKTAERLILELREKVVAQGLGGAAAEGGPGAGAAESSPLALARAALMELGYSSLDAERALAGLDPALPVEELIRHALTRGR